MVIYDWFSCMFQDSVSAGSYNDPFLSSVSKLCEDKFCVNNLCVSKLCEDKLCVSKLCDDKMCEDKLCEDKLCDDKMCEDKWCVSKLCEDKLCVWKVWRQTTGGGREADGGVQNQKQEPHTKMWGKRTKK